MRVKTYVDDQWLVKMSNGSAAMKISKDIHGLPTIEIEWRNPDYLTVLKKDVERG